MELILIRHGETDGNQRGAFIGWSDPELNGTGKAQAYAIREKLSGQPLDIIFSSPLKRAFQTATIINETYGKKIRTSDSLRERDFGRWDNLTLADIKTHYPDEAERWLTDPAYVFPGGESLEHFQQRIRSFSDDLIQKNPQGRIWLVTHGGCIRTMLAYLLELKLENSWRFKVNVGGIAKVEIDESRYAYLTMLNG